MSMMFVLAAPYQKFLVPPLEKVFFFRMCTNKWFSRNFEEITLYHRLKRQQPADSDRQIKRRALSRKLIFSRTVNMSCNCASRQHDSESTLVFAGLLME
jgi:hypothetical protein